MSVGYIGSDDIAKKKFDSDMKRLLEITEMMNLNAINGFDSVSVLDSVF